MPNVHLRSNQSRAVDVMLPKKNGFEVPGSDVHVAWLRQKLDNPQNFRRIQTVRGKGYKFIFLRRIAAVMESINGNFFFVPGEPVTGEK